ncbi:MAG: NfeD family protein [Thermodesulfobacteriota bacterium]
MDLSQAALIWLICGVVLFLLEMALPGFILFFFGIGAWTTALICWVAPNMSLAAQLGIFLISSLLSLFALRGLIKRTFFGDSEDGLQDQVTARGGEQAVVTSAIHPPAEGKIKYSGSFWRAVADTPIDKDKVVTIVSQDNLVMRVKKHNMEQEGE